MKTRLLAGLVLALLGTLGPSAHAAPPKKATLGVFLPTSLADGQQRFQLAESLAARFTETLKKPVAPKSFGRYEDFSKAAADGQIDYALVDAWAAVQLARATPLALASLEGDSAQRWAIVSSSRASVKELAGKKLALVKGAGATPDPRFLSNVVLGGDLDAKKHFQLVPVPNVESAVKMLEAKGAEAALVPASQAPASARVLFRSGKVPGAVLLVLRGSAEEVNPVLKQLPVAPVEGFTPVQPKEYESFKRLVQSGPPKRQPLLADFPSLHMRTDALLSPDVLAPVLPSFADALDVPETQPDD